MALALLLVFASAIAFSNGGVLSHSYQSGFANGGSQHSSSQSSSHHHHEVSSESHEENSSFESTDSSHEIGSSFGVGLGNGFHSGGTNLGGDLQFSHSLPSKQTHNVNFAQRHSVHNPVIGPLNRSPSGPGLAPLSQSGLASKQSFEGVSQLPTWREPSATSFGSSSPFSQPHSVSSQQAFSPSRGNTFPSSTSFSPSPHISHGAFPNLNNFPPVSSSSSPHLENPLFPSTYLPNTPSSQRIPSFPRNYRHDSPNSLVFSTSNSGVNSNNFPRFPASPSVSGRNAKDSPRFPMPPSFSDSNTQGSPRFSSSHSNLERDFPNTLNKVSDLNTPSPHRFPSFNENSLGRNPLNPQRVPPLPRSSGVNPQDFQRAPSLSTNSPGPQRIPPSPVSSEVNPTSPQREPSFSSFSEVNPQNPHRVPPFPRSSGVSQPSSLRIPSFNENSPIPQRGVFSFPSKSNGNPQSPYFSNSMTLSPQRVSSLPGDSNLEPARPSFSRTDSPKPQENPLSPSISRVNGPIIDSVPSFTRNTDENIPEPRQLPLLSNKVNENSPSWGSPLFPGFDTKSQSKERDTFFPKDPILKSPSSGSISSFPVISNGNDPRPSQVPTSPVNSNELSPSPQGNSSFPRNTESSSPSPQRSPSSDAKSAKPESIQTTSSSPSFPADSSGIPQRVQPLSNNSDVNSSALPSAPKNPSKASNEMNNPFNEPSDKQNMISSQFLNSVQGSGSPFSQLPKPIGKYPENYPVNGLPKIFTVTEQSKEPLPTSASQYKNLEVFNRTDPNTPAMALSKPIPNLHTPRNSPYSNYLDKPEFQTLNNSKLQYVLPSQSYPNDANPLNVFTISQPSLTQPILDTPIRSTSNINSNTLNRTTPSIDLQSTAIKNDPTVPNKSINPSLEPVKSVLNDKSSFKPLIETPLKNSENINPSFSLPPSDTQAPTKTSPTPIEQQTIPNSNLTVKPPTNETLSLKTTNNFTKEPGFSNLPSPHETVTQMNSPRPTEIIHSPQMTIPHNFGDLKVPNIEPTTTIQLVEHKNVPIVNGKSALMSENSALNTNNLPNPPLTLMLPKEPTTVNFEKDRANALNVGQPTLLPQPALNNTGVTPLVQENIELKSTNIPGPVNPSLPPKVTTVLNPIQGEIKVSNFESPTVISKVLDDSQVPATFGSPSAITGNVALNSTDIPVNQPPSQAIPSSEPTMRFGGNTIKNDAKVPRAEKPNELPKTLQTSDLATDLPKTLETSNVTTNAGTPSAITENIAVNPTTNQPPSLVTTSSGSTVPSSGNPNKGDAKKHRAEQPNDLPKTEESGNVATNAGTPSAITENIAPRPTNLPVPNQPPSEVTPSFGSTVPSRGNPNMGDTKIPRAEQPNDLPKTLETSNVANNAGSPTVITENIAVNPTTLPIANQPLSQVIPSSGSSVPSGGNPNKEEAKVPRAEQPNDLPKTLETRNVAINAGTPSAITENIAPRPTNLPVLNQPPSEVTPSSGSTVPSGGNPNKEDVKIPRAEQPADLLKTLETSNVATSAGSPIPTAKNIAVNPTNLPESKQPPNQVTFSPVSTMPFGDNPNKDNSIVPRAEQPTALPKQLNTNMPTNAGSGQEKVVLTSSILPSSNIPSSDMTPFVSAGPSESSPVKDDLITQIPEMRSTMPLQVGNSKTALVSGVGPEEVSMISTVDPTVSKYADAVTPPKAETINTPGIVLAPSVEAEGPAIVNIASGFNAGLFPLDEPKTALVDSIDTIVSPVDQSPTVLTSGQDTISAVSVTGASKGEEAEPEVEARSSNVDTNVAIAKPEEARSFAFPVFRPFSFVTLTMPAFAFSLPSFPPYLSNYLPYMYPFW